MSCNCAFCFYCETNVSIHGFHNLIYFAVSRSLSVSSGIFIKICVVFLKFQNPLPDLLNDLNDTETSFEKEFEKFKFMSQILKDHDVHPLSMFVCQSLDRMIAHCFEVID